MARLPQVAHERNHLVLQVMEAQHACRGRHGRGVLVRARDVSELTGRSRPAGARGCQACNLHCVSVAVTVRWSLFLVIFAGPKAFGPSPSLIRNHVKPNTSRVGEQHAVLCGGCTSLRTVLNAMQAQEALHAVLHALHAARRAYAILSRQGRGADTRKHLHTLHFNARSALDTFIHLEVRACRATRERGRCGSMLHRPFPS